MGSGISLTKEQIKDIVKRELEETFYVSENLKSKCDEYGKDIYEDFSDEEELYKKIKILNKLWCDYNKLWCSSF